MSEAPVLDPRDDKRRLKLWLQLLACSQSIEKAIRARLRAEHDATLPRFDVMAALDRHPEGLTMGEISRRLRVSGGNVTGVVERLVQDGQVRRRQRDGDRRSLLIALTDAGRADFERMAAEHRAWVDEMLAGLDEAEASQLATLLGRLQASVAASVGEGDGT